jgi:hypothetical protein
MKSVLHNFLGTFTSRYSDYNGYWLMGFPVSERQPLEIDLLDNGAAPDNTPVASARAIAGSKFRDQLTKHGLAVNCLTGARVSIEIPPDEIDGQVDSHLCRGRAMTLRAEATVEGGRRFESRRTVFVAQHNPLFEHRRRQR